MISDILLLGIVEARTLPAVSQGGLEMSSQDPYIKRRHGLSLEISILMPFSPEALLFLTKYLSAAGRVFLAFPFSQFVQLVNPGHPALNNKTLRLQLTIPHTRLRITRLP